MTPGFKMLAGLLRRHVSAYNKDRSLNLGWLGSRTRLAQDGATFFFISLFIFISIFPGSHHSVSAVLPPQLSPTALRQATCDFRQPSQSCLLFFLYTAAVQYAFQ
ncbi:hypothetical protein BDZ89DRAFT_1060844 [Hymenopellis radicata]|nr:hypothetical protein BDZ89DRAFT_1060844 [Hymenopellis radicata]